MASHRQERVTHSLLSVPCVDNAARRLRAEPTFLAGSADLLFANGEKPT